MITDANREDVPAEVLPGQKRRLGDLKPRKGANPNSISSPACGLQSCIRWDKPPSCVQVSKGLACKAG